MRILSCISRQNQYKFWSDYTLDAARLWGDSHWLPSDYDIFQYGALPYSHIMNNDIGKFVYDSMQKDKNHEKDLTKNL